MSEANESRMSFEDEAPRYVIGVDLGTTNSAVGFIDRSEAESGRRIRVFGIPQLVAPGEMGSRPMLPSFLYLPGDYDLPPGSTALPWDPDRNDVVGEFAREQGAKVPARLVASAKSWLSHGGVDRTAPILPWAAAGDIPKVSPIEASRRYLSHIREAWNHRMASQSARFEEQLVVLTIPASFDEVARELTLEAAHRAGIPNAVLLEEPLAAFYDWLSRHESDWQERMRESEIILVCDVGGGTTDFSILGVRAGSAGLRFDRLAVGEHLILGGDNMDMALGRDLEARLAGGTGQLDADRWHQLVHQCRAAKERLLGDANETPAVEVTVVGTGSGLISGTMKGALRRDEARERILDGFFPEVALEERPAERRRTGLTELGLPYVQDPAVTRHLAAFWQRFRGLLESETQRAAVYPDYVLFNGGALTPDSVRGRLVKVVGNWFAPVAGADWHPAELDHPHPELAVALGAAYYGLVRLGQGVRVGSGSPRAYFVGVQAKEPSPETAALPALCLVPRGAEEGFAAELPGPDFLARTNQPVSFPIFSSSTRLGDGLGEIVELSPDETTSLPPIRTVLRYGKGTVQELPVRIAVRLTEVGTLELWCHARDSEHRWRLLFDVRQTAAPPSPAVEESRQEILDQGLVESASGAIESAFGAGGAPELPPERLRSSLEEVLGRRKERWPTPLVRQLADSLLENREGRLRTPEHEHRWLNLLGFCLRPGLGHPLDDWRLKQAWKLYPRGLAFPRQTQCRVEWWIFWRRVAGGLSVGKQVQIYQDLRPYLDPDSKGKKKPSPMFPKRLAPGEEIEIWMALAHFEWLPPETKSELGRLLLARMSRRRPRSQELWAIGRLGSRRPMYGPLDRVIPAAEAAEWVERLLEMELEPTSSSAHSLVLLAGATGDRSRDVSADVRDRVHPWLDPIPDAASLRDLLENPESGHRAEEAEWMFGESLPAGLVLTASP